MSQLLLQFAISFTQIPSVINDYGRILKYNFKVSVFNYQIHITVLNILS